MLLTCKNCGGELIVQKDTAKCKFCGEIFPANEVKGAPPTFKKIPSEPSPLSELPLINDSPTLQDNAGESKPLEKPVGTPDKKPQNSAGIEMNAEDIYEQNRLGVVEIITEDGRASGFIISKKGLVLTNTHAIIDENGNPCKKILVKQGDECALAHIIALGDTDVMNPNSADLALLAVSDIPSGWTELRCGTSSHVKIGQRVYYIGNSKGEGLCMTAGIVSDKNRKVGKRDYIMTDAATNPGNSGGPLFNTVGEVIGVHVSARMEAVGMKYAIPMDTARVFLNTIEDKLGIPHDTLAEQMSPKDKTSSESVAAGIVLTLVLSGITLLVENIKFIQSIIDALK